MSHPTGVKVEFYAWKVSISLCLGRQGIEESLLRHGGSLEVDARVSRCPLERIEIVL